jgi:hypothetical protein
MVKEIEEGQEEGGGSEEEGGEEEKGSGKELESVEEAAGEEAEIAADGAEVEDVEPGLVEEEAQAVAGVAKVVVGCLMDFPFEGGDEEELTTGLEDAGEFGEDKGGMADMLEGDDVEAGIEGGGGQGEGGEIGDTVEAAVVPMGVTDSQIDGEIAVGGELGGVTEFAGAGVEDTGGRGKGLGEAGDGALDFRFKMENPVAKPRRQAVDRGAIEHGGRG